MARELPIHNGRMTTDLDANGFKIKNLPPGSGFTQAQADWNQADATAPDFIKNKPTIPAPVTVDATLTTQGAAADAKAVGDALLGGFTEWEFSDGGAHAISGPVATADGWAYVLDGTESSSPFYDEASALSATTVLFNEVSATRHLITPTKTSQLTNDGDGTNAFVKTNDTRLSDSRTPTAHHATHVANGSDPLAPADIGAAAASDLPYAMVEPGEWEFSGLQDGMEVVSDMSFVETSSDTYYWQVFISVDGGQLEFASEEFSDISHANDLSVVLTSIGGYTVSATRPSLPGHLLDRANNLIDATTGNMTLTLPAYQAGKLRDLLVYVDLGDDGTDPYSITFNFPSGESNTGFKAEGDDPTSATFPAPTAAGEWWYSFTECKPHKFAVSLKRLQDAPQTQGGS